MENEFISCDKQRRVEAMVVRADCEMNISTAGKCFFYMVGQCAASVAVLEGDRGPLPWLLRCVGGGMSSVLVVD